MALRSTTLLDRIPADLSNSASLFERFPRLYAFFRERVFRDDTDRIVESIWRGRPPERGSTLIELGCGPGFYARRLSQKFPHLIVVGIDRSPRQLELAVKRSSTQTRNCRFERGDAQAISFPSGSVDVVIASRLFMVLPEPQRAVFEIHRVLRPGGCCFIAEPRPHPIARLPLDLLWTAAGIGRVFDRKRNSYQEPLVPVLMERAQFDSLISSQRWHAMSVTSDRRYQYAVCVKH